MSLVVMGGNRNPVVRQRVGLSFKSLTLSKFFEIIFFLNALYINSAPLIEIKRHIYF